MDEIKVTSTFGHEEDIPATYTCQGENINPALSIENVPEGTQSLALIMDDPDAPGGTFVHWVVWNMPVADVAEDSSPGVVGKNSKGENAYTGPCPPSGVHRYFFKVYALDEMLMLSEDTDKNDLIEAMEGHILGKGELIGLYEK